MKPDKKYKILTFPKTKLTRFGETTCKTCGVKFWKTAGVQIYCGSLMRKTGCSYKAYIKRATLWNIKKHAPVRIKKLQMRIKKQQQNLDALILKHKKS
jgi:hypothetical protein